MTEYTFTSSKGNLDHKTAFGTRKGAEWRAMDLLKDWDETIYIEGSDGSYGECFLNDRDEKVVEW